MSSGKVVYESSLSCCIPAGSSRHGRLTLHKTHGLRYGVLLFTLPPLCCYNVLVICQPLSSIDKFRLIMHYQNRSLFEYMLDFYYQTGAVVIESRSWRGEKVCQ